MIQPQADQPGTADERFLPKDGLQALLDALTADGRTIVGPKIDQQAVVYGELESVEELPRGWTDDQAPGTYRLSHLGDDRYFGYAVGPHSWKQYLFPPVAIVASARRAGSSWEMQTPQETPPRYAFLGVRACELAAIRVQDRVFLEGPYVDPIYEARRSAVLIIAVNCTQAAATCFCTSMDTGPRCQSGFDLALTETDDGFVLESGTDAGRQILAALPVTAVTPQQTEDAEAARQQAVEQISRRMDTDGIRDLLLGHPEHERWDQVATRCLSCTNCTMVCPTCFCSTVKEVSDLQGERVDRQREWDSCFNVDFSVMNGGVVRDDVRSRYRQWLTHKLASWHDQFDQSGCVGCGRCITWCPPGIDLTEEVWAIRDSVGESPSSEGKTS